MVEIYHSQLLCRVRERCWFLPPPPDMPEAKTDGRSVPPDTTHAGDSDFEDLYENAPCGYLSVRSDGRIDRANRTLAGWLAYGSAIFPRCGSATSSTWQGGFSSRRMWAPLLRMQGFFDEFALDLLTKNGTRLLAIANARERRDDAGALLFTRLTVIPASDRRRYERELIDARKQSDELMS